MSKQLQIEQMRDRLHKYMEMPVSDNMVERVALYSAALAAMCGHEQAEPAEQVQVASVQAETLEPVRTTGGAWRDVVAGKDMQAVADVMDKHFDVISAIAPKHYAAVLSALDKI